MLDAVLFEIVFDVASNVLTFSVRMEYLDPLTGFQFHPCNERLE